MTNTRKEKPRWGVPLSKEKAKEYRAEAPSLCSRYASRLRFASQQQRVRVSRHTAHRPSGITAGRSAPTAQEKCSLSCTEATWTFAS